jgi:ABC-type glycerol-3-phosphate transport system permease component
MSDRVSIGAGIGDRVVGGTIKTMLLIWVAINLLVVLWVILTSLKTTREIYAAPFALPKIPQWQNFVSAWSSAGLGASAVNSLMVVVFSAVLIIVIGAPAAYVLGRVKRLSAVPITTFFALGMGIPFQTVLVPLFLVSNSISSFMTDWVTGAWDDRVTLVLFYVVLSLPFSVFILTGFFRRLPAELEEAAALDGASPLRTFASIMFPLARPGIVTVLVLNIVSLWNETVLVLVLVPDPDQRTLPPALLNLYNSMQFTSNWGGLFAGIVIVVMPMIILYLWVGRRIIDGMTQGIGK